MLEHILLPHKQLLAQLAPISARTCHHEHVDCSGEHVVPVHYAARVTENAAEFRPGKPPYRLCRPIASDSEIFPAD